MASLCLAVLVRAAASSGSQLSSINHQLVAEQLTKSPAVFIENKGQWADESIRFALSSRGVNVGVTDEGLRFQLFQGSATVSVAASGVAPLASNGLTQPKMKANGVVESVRRDAEQSTRDARAPRMKEFSVHFVGAGRVKAEGEGKAQQVFNYHRGEPERWRENVPSYEAVVYRGVYQGIDLRVTGGRTGIKYEFIVAPGADWRQVRVRYERIERLTLRDDGALVAHLGNAETAAPRQFSAALEPRTQIKALKS